MIRVRPARSGDLACVLEIARHSATVAGWNQAEYSKVFSPDPPRGLVALVIDENDVVMGFLVSRQVAGDEWEIENVAVNGAARRRGLGTRLLGEFLNYVRAHRGRNIYLEVRESNHAALALYEKWAFVEMGRRKSYYQNPVEDALVLRFSFAEAL